MSKKSNEPFLWFLFSAGGVVAAFSCPFCCSCTLLFRWDGCSPQAEQRLVKPSARLVLFVLCSLPLFRLRFASPCMTVCRSNI
jgi:fumarate reductase subunit D